jgi:hypothetical protein
VAVERLTEAQVRALAVTVSVPVAGSAFGLCRNQSYKLARLARTDPGQFPCEILSLGGRLVVTKTALMRALGYETAPAREDAA